MRSFVFVTLIGTSLVLSMPAHAAWAGYDFDEFGISKDFPAEPTRTETIYAAPRSISGEAPPAADSISQRFGLIEITEGAIESVKEDRPAVHFEVELDNIVYAMTIADFREDLDRSANVVLECINLYEEAGVLISNFPARTSRREDPEGGTWGREVTVDLPDNRGRVVGACYFTKGRLYRFEAHVLPENGNMNALESVRFANAFNFHIDDEIE